MIPRARPSTTMQLEHLVPGVAAHRARGHLPLEGLVGADEQLLAGLAAGVEGARDLDPAERAVVEQPAVLAGERDALGDALVDDVHADLGQPVDVRLAGAVVAALDGVVEESVDRVSVALVVLGRVDAALCRDRVSPARAVLVAERLDDIAGLTERRGGGGTGQAGPDHDDREPAAVGRVGDPGFELPGAPALLERAAGRLGVTEGVAVDVVAGRVVVLLPARLPAGRGIVGAGGVRHVRTGGSRGHEITPARMQIGTSENPPAITTASSTPSTLALRRARALLVSPRVCAALQTPCRRCMPSAIIATR